MKCLKINNRDYVLKYTTRSIMNLNSKGITLTKLTKDMEDLNLAALYETFCEGLKFANKDITIEEACDIIDAYYEEGGEMESFFMIILEEYSKSMGLGKQFKEIQTKQQTN